MSERLPHLELGARFGECMLRDEGDLVELEVCRDFRGSLEFLSVDQVRELRDWLSAWLERQETDSE